MAKKIAITYEKGGVGKTTTAVNLSAILAEKGFKVLLVDLDLQSYATSYFDLYDDTLPCIYEVMCEDNAVTAADAIRQTDIDGLELMPSNYRFRKMETVLMMKTKRQEYTLKKCLSPVEQNLNRIMTLSYLIIRLTVSASRKTLSLMRIFLFFRLFRMTTPCTVCCAYQLKLLMSKKMSTHSYPYLACWLRLMKTPATKRLTNRSYRNKRYFRHSERLSERIHIFPKQETHISRSISMTAAVTAMQIILH